MTAKEKILGIMPVIGLGTWEMKGSSCVNSVISGLRLGYRHIDTAQMYGNETEIGKAIRQSGIDRNEIFVTTKVATGNLTPSRIKRSFTESLEKLATGYVDLLLIHWPTEEMVLEDCLDAMFELKEKNFVKYVGVSNFDPQLFKKAIDIGPVVTNQLKFTPYHVEFENLSLAKEENKIITAYSPLARGRIEKDRTLKNIGSKYKKTEFQVALRWLIQLGNISVIPKAEKELHQEQNLDIFDFELSSEDMESVKQLSKKLTWH